MNQKRENIAKKKGKEDFQKKVVNNIRVKTADRKRAMSKNKGPFTFLSLLFHKAQEVIGTWCR